MIEHIWKGLPERFSDVRLDEFVVMPNHVHFILWLPGSDGVGAALAPPNDQGAASSAPTLGKVVRAFKSISAIAVNKQLNRQGTPVWQRNYFERVVRNERELNAIRQYIIYNLMMWDQDCENPERAPAGAHPSFNVENEIECVLESVRDGKTLGSVAPHDGIEARRAFPSGGQ